MAQRYLLRPRIVLLAATDNEFAAAKRALQDAAGHFHAGPKEASGQLGVVDVFLRLVGKPGNVGSASATRAAIGEHRPACIIGVGHCVGELDHLYGKRKLLDTVISEHIVYYVWNGLHGKTENTYCEKFRANIDRTILSRIVSQGRITIPVELAPKTHEVGHSVEFGDYASGELYHVRKEHTIEVGNTVLQSVGVQPSAYDMEAAGIHEGCKESGTPFFVAKAISCFDVDSKESAQHRAAAAFVSTARVLLWIRSIAIDDVRRLRQPVVTVGKEDHRALAEQAVAQAGWLLPRPGTQVKITLTGGTDDLETSYDDLIRNFLRRCIGGGRGQIITEGKPRVTDEENAFTYDEWWLIDPVDGTLNLVEGRPEIAISIGYGKRSLPLVGVVGLPYRHWIVSGSKADGVKLNGHPVQPKSRPKLLADAVLSLPGDLAKIRKKHPGEWTFQNLAPQARVVRVSGALAYDLALLAVGEIDARISTWAKPMDVAAGVVLVEGIGGKVSRLDGRPWNAETTGIVAAATPELHADLMRAIGACSSIAGRDSVPPHPGQPAQTIATAPQKTEGGAFVPSTP